MNSWCESCAKKNQCYTVDIRPKCFVPITSNDRMIERETEPQEEGERVDETCANCKFGYEGWFGEMCNSCCSVHSNWQPKTEPQTCENRKCKNYDTINDHCMFIEQCHYESKTEPRSNILLDAMAKTFGVEDELKKCVNCNHYKLTCDLFSEICRYEPKTEPQTEGADDEKSY